MNSNGSCGSFSLAKMTTFINGTPCTVVPVTCTINAISGCIFEVNNPTTRIQCGCATWQCATQTQTQIILPTRNHQKDIPALSFTRSTCPSDTFQHSTGTSYYDKEKGNHGNDESSGYSFLLHKRPRLPRPGSPQYWGCHSHDPSQYHR